MKAQPIIMVYNPKTLQPPKTKQGKEQQYLTPCFVQNEKFRGSEAIFTDPTSGQKIAVAGLHLDYDANTQNDVKIYQDAKMQDNLTAIALGDLNSTLNKKMQGQILRSAIIDYNHPTNIDASGVDADGDKDPNTLTLKDNQETNLNKAYDAAFVNPDRNGQVDIEEHETQHFVMEGNKAKVKTTNLKDSTPIHRSLPGQAWIKGAHHKQNLL